MGTNESCRGCGGEGFFLHVGTNFLHAYCVECFTCLEFALEDSEPCCEELQKKAEFLLLAWGESGQQMTATQAEGIIELLGEG